MQFKSLGLVIASVVLTSFFCGCATKMGNTQEALTVERGHDPNNRCTWHFDRDPSPKGKVRGSIVVDTGPCSAEPASGTLFIGNSANQGMRVVRIDGVEFALEGSCKYCYTNTGGGMSCVTYPPPC